MDKRNAPSHEDALLIKLTCDSTIKYIYFKYIDFNYISSKYY